MLLGCCPNQELLLVAAVDNFDIDQAWWQVGQTASTGELTLREVIDLQFTWIWLRYQTLQFGQQLFDHLDLSGAREQHQFLSIIA